MTGAWLVLVERDAPHREVGIVALRGLDSPTEALARLAVAYGVEVASGDLDALAERWREGAPLHEDPRAMALFWPRSGGTWDRTPLARPPDEPDRQIPMPTVPPPPDGWELADGGAAWRAYTGRPQAPALTEHGQPADRTRPGVASGDGSVGGPPEAPAVIGVDAGSPVGYTEEAAADRRTDATPTPGGCAPGVSCVWCGGPLPPPTDVGGRPRITCSVRCRSARHRAQQRADRERLEAVMGPVRAAAAEAHAEADQARRGRLP